MACSEVRAELFPQSLVVHRPRRREGNTGRQNDGSDRVNRQNRQDLKMLWTEIADCTYHSPRCFPKEREKLCEWIALSGCLDCCVCREQAVLVTALMVIPGRLLHRLTRRWLHNPTAHRKFLPGRFGFPPARPELLELSTLRLPFNEHRCQSIPAWNQPAKSEYRLPLMLEILVLPKRLTHLVTTKRPRSNAAEHGRLSNLGLGRW